MYVYILTYTYPFINISLKKTDGIELNALFCGCFLIVDSTYTIQIKTVPWSQSPTNEEDD